MTINQPVPATDAPKSKLSYINNVKVLLTGLVIIHHVLVTYGAPGGWYYSEKTSLAGALIPMTIVVAINQSFFMGYFFFLSALFVPSSYNKKGAGRFITDRLLRLGIPLMFYSFVLSPFMNYLVYYYAGEHHISFGQYLSGYDDWVSFGVMWFVVALLLFTICYAVIRLVSKSAITIRINLPSNKRILLFATGVGVISFAVRIIFPVGWVLKPLGFQLGHFTQYIALFTLGIIASNNNWLGQISQEQARRMRRIAISIGGLGLLSIYAIKVIFNVPIEWFSGGFNYISLLYSVWEQLTGFAICVAVTGIAKYRWDNRSAMLGNLLRAAFATYIFHPLVLIVLSILFRPLAIDPAVKALLVAPLGVAGSFALALLLVRMPLVNRVI
ncbi:acyltransferase [Mucilaginibacter sp. UR6-1]|uniref:acyltransferase family protein n=1 Tax=Mucilaginibacter sp. UR6-1 TaxID=1435643 RepID=UPI001E52E53D|nr:acyltransferase [Mucilaginibacter sp. UR6-1]MCC8408644.1 acyltransferase [Mucilaginibacter sp. UR6-1]